MNWYDMIVLDKAWVEHRKFWMLPGTKDIPFVQIKMAVEGIAV